MVRAIRIDRKRAKAAALAVGMLGLCGADVSARVDPGANACAERVVRDLRAERFEEVTALLMEPPSYDAEQVKQDRDSSTSGLRAIFATVGKIDDVAPMMRDHRYYRAGIAGGTPEAWASAGRPSDVEAIERDVRFARAGDGVLVLAVTKNGGKCGVFTLAIGLDSEQVESREKMIEVYVAVMKAIGMSGDPAEMRQRAESMLTIYDAVVMEPAARPTGEQASPPSGDAPAGEAR